ncbi:MAG: hypothetical protein JWP45_3582 [Mucilaginibacter sp.]|nr:hypothetical protein [Mucilaginibacter sp.]
MEVVEQPKVFISYSHDSEEHRNWVLQLATRLRSNGVDIILDRWNLRLGQDLPLFMEQGLASAHRVICVCSTQYVHKANNPKGGVGYEKMIITGDLINNLDTEWVIPIIRNNQEVRKTPRFLGNRMYQDFSNDSQYEASYWELLRELLDEQVLPIPVIGPNPFKQVRELGSQIFGASNTRYVSPSVRGNVTFDCTNNDGKYTIGQGELMFELCFSQASMNSIYIYNDSSSIATVCIAENISQINDIQDARIYDTSSRHRLVYLNHVAVCQNTNGYYAAIKILPSEGINSMNELAFEYQIQSNGSYSFIVHN